MGKLFAMLTEAEHCCNENCNIERRRVPVGRSSHPMVPPPMGWREFCLTEEAEEARAEPKQYRCATCFSKKHTKAFQDMLASVIGRMYIINISDMKMVKPEWGKPE